MTSCPGCRGPKSRRAKLCRGCRRAAITAGINLITGSGHGSYAPAVTEDRKLSEGQRRAFHAKCNHLDRLLEQPYGTNKGVMLASVGIEHANDLTAEQASGLLDDLERRIAEAAPPVV